MRENFWERYSLGELNAREWEALCDGCGQCCLLRRVDDGVVTVYSVACELLDIASARCGDYANRLQKVPDCHKLTPATVPECAGWLPETCAYRRLHEKRTLPSWHPLLTGDRSRMRKKGITVSHYAVPRGSLARRQKERHIAARWPLGEQKQCSGRKAQRRRGGRGR
ncbi:MAG TPA: YcgN family cysteine cluster protein [Kiloniellales bacterium]|nr:YcgN family cysteine cluster protein [Kiloniellales bacterium]